MSTGKSTRANSDRPLTDAQERALIALSDHNDRYGFDSFVKPQGVQAMTLYRLRTMGLVATEERPTTVVARITEAGIAMLDSMGD